MKEKIRFVLKFAKPYKWKFVTMQICMVLTTISLVILPFIIGWLIDEVLYSKNMSRFIFIVCVYGLVYMFNQAMFTVQNILEKVLSTVFLFDMRAELYSRILKFKGKYLTSLYSGDIISRMGYDADQIMDMVCMKLFGLVTNILNLCIALGFIFYASRWLGLFTALITPIIIYTSSSFYKKAKSKNFSVQKEKGLLSSWIFEILGGMQEIKLLHASKHVISEFLRRSIKITRLTIDLNKIEVLAERMNAAISFVAQMLLFTLAAFLVRNDRLTIGGVTACFAYYTTCISSFNSINSKILALSSNMVSCDRIMELFAVELEESSVRPDDFDNSKNPFSGSIEFESVSFHYTNQQSLLEDVSFRINPQDKIAIVGHSGVGKSTLVNLLCRIYDVDSGTIYINETDIRDYDIKYLRRQIGIVHQNSIIFNGSLRFNLCFTDD